MTVACAMTATVSFAQSAYNPPSAGTLITWSYQFENESFTRLSEIVASGDDFVIYQPDIRYAADTPEQYVVEFAGVHAQTCADPLPDEDDRSALMAIWPLLSGSSASVRTGPTPSRYMVQAKENVDFLVSRPGQQSVFRVRGKLGSADLQFLVSEDYSIPIGMDWPGGENGRVIDLVEPEGGAGTDMELNNLGYCSELVKQ
ncbi:hypothetical protein WNY37_14870 [Henriciella sp. AS95]|uniref:hypothetical protein n=1 Tax=Henriciella sp. AS95 TaxID=3135782 RepID=UPI00317ED967